MKKSILLFLVLLSLTLSVFAAPASAQGNGMDSVPFFDWLQTVMQQLESELTAEPAGAEIPSATPTALPVPADTPVPEQTIPDLPEDREQLLELLLLIQQRLGDNGESAAAETELTATPVAAEVTPEASPESPAFEIYTDKKLFLERMPDDRFIRKPSETAEPGKDKKKDGGGIWDDDGETCPPGLFWYCDAEKCICISPNG